MSDTPPFNTLADAHLAPMGVSSAILRELDIVADWGLLATDADFKITFLNSWLERKTDRPVDSLLGQQLFEVFPSLATRSYADYYAQALDGRTSVLSQRLHKYLLPLPPPAMQSQFEYMQQTSRIIPLVDDGGVCGTLTIIEDVTERVAYETELRERVTALREADRHKDEFLAMLAHELRNPLAPISNAVQLLRLSGVDNLIVDGAQEVLQRQITHLVRLVDDLLDVSRVSCGKIQLHKLRVDLCAVARQAIEISRPLIDSRLHHFDLDLPKYPVLVDGDFVRLSQLIGNLLNNAAKYTDAGGDISLSVETAPGIGDGMQQAVIRVRDNGRGIDPAVRDSLFTLFYQADRNLDRSEGGLGVGLALARSLAEMHGGTIEVASPGRGMGSEFVVRLPVFTDVDPAAAASEPFASASTNPMPT